MKREYVESVAIRSVGYNKVEKILEIEFRTRGAVWQYFNVSAFKFRKFMQAESKGNYFVTKIKGRHPETLVKG